MAKPKTARWEEKREAILDAATHVLNRNGLSGFRLADVAAQIGLKRPSIVYYFANVEELAEALYARALAQLEERVSHAEQGGDPRECLARLFELELAHHADERAGLAIRRPQLGEIRALSSDRRRGLGRRYHGILERVASMLGKDVCSARLVEVIAPAQVIMETVFWLPAWIDEYETWAFPRLREVLVETLLDGVMAKDTCARTPYIPEEPRLERKAIDQDDYLRSATRLICAMGFRGGGIDRISAELGVTKGSFYHHINQKDELIEACFAHSQQRLSAIQRRAAERDMSPAERLRAVISTLISIQIEGRFPLLRSSALPALSADARTKIIAQSNRNFRWFASEIAEGIANGEMHSRDPHVSAQVLGAAINAIFDLPRLYGEGIGAKDVPYCAALLMHGILTPPQ